MVWALPKLHHYTGTAGSPHYSDVICGKSGKGAPYYTAQQSFHNVCVVCLLSAVLMCRGGSTRRTESGSWRSTVHITAKQQSVFRFTELVLLVSIEHVTLHKSLAGSAPQGRETPKPKIEISREQVILCTFTRGPHVYDLHHIHDHTSYREIWRPAQPHSSS